MSATGTAASPAPEVTARRLARAEQKVALLEAMIEDRTRSLFLAQEELRRSNDFLRKVLRTMESALFVTDAECRIIVVGGSASRLLGRDDTDLLDTPLYELVAGLDTCPVFDQTAESEREVVFERPDGTTVPALVTTSPMLDEDGQLVAMVNVATDLTERQRLEHERRHAQKLESIGQLAAGVAHEINTPVQFIGDSTRFLGDVLEDLLALIDAQRRLCELARRGDPVDAALAEVAELEEVADLEFVRDEAPRAVERTVHGVRRVSEIVAALKQFAHPGTGAAAACQLDEIARTTLVVASNEYRYVADVVTDLQAVPAVLADAGDLSQAVLNLVVNAAHAIADRGDDQRGRIDVRTRVEGHDVVLEVADTGTGIPAEILERIFDPFFTTKEVGRGTGQGLAIVRSLVDRHRGTVEVDTEPGVGTTFRIRLPREAA